jgi:hypothetical protein
MTGSKKNSVLLLLIALIIATIPIAAAETTLTIGDFSRSSTDQELPDGWELFTFDKIESHTNYSLVKENGKTVIKAESHAACSGLISRVRIDPEKYPLVRWRWKATNIYRQGDVTLKSGDDYPARLVITFEYDRTQVGLIEKLRVGLVELIYGEIPPSGALNYIWANRAPIGTVVSNPYTDRIKMIVIESGPKKLNTWITEERNIYQDYLSAFGRKPPMVNGMVIMTDSDDTKESGITFYGDIEFKKIDSKKE